MLIQPCSWLDPHARINSSCPTLPHLLTSDVLPLEGPDAGGLEVSVKNGGYPKMNRLEWKIHENPIFGNLYINGYQSSIKSLHN